MTKDFFSQQEYRVDVKSLLHSPFVELTLRNSSQIIQPSLNDITIYWLQAERNKTATELMELITLFSTDREVQLKQAFLFGKLKLAEELLKNATSHSYTEGNDS
jgi:hypothetical protein